MNPTTKNMNSIIATKGVENTTATICSQKPTYLRCVTYMYPSLPMELFQAIVEHLETVLKVDVGLQHEWRESVINRVDLLKHDLVDIVFMTSTQYLKLIEDKNNFAELLPVTPVFKHAKNKFEEPGYYADVIVHAEKLRKLATEDLKHLRGSHWAYSSPDSLSGSKVLLNRLNQIGENASFFGHALRSGSHLESLQMVLRKQAEAACIDATTLEAYKSILPDNARDAVVLESIGPLPPYPIVINNRLPDNLKQAIVRAFLNFPRNDPKFTKFGLIKFAPNHKDNYEEIKEIQEAVQYKSFTVPYY